MDQNDHDSQGIDEDVESCSHPQFDQKSATLTDFRNPTLHRCKSRRLQFLSRGFARTPLHALSLAASPARSDRVARSLRLLAVFLFESAGPCTHGALHSALGAEAA